MKRLSILGLCILIASAFIARIAPARKSVNEFQIEAHATETENGEYTCIAGVPTGMHIACVTTTGNGDETDDDEIDSGTETINVTGTFAEATIKD